MVPYLWFGTDKSVICCPGQEPVDLSSSQYCLVERMHLSKKHVALLISLLKVFENGTSSSQQYRFIDSYDHMWVMSYDAKSEMVEFQTEKLICSQMMGSDWVELHFPEGTIYPKMVLTKDLINEIIPLLKCFEETGHFNVSDDVLNV